MALMLDRIGLLAALLLGVLIYVFGGANALILMFVFLFLSIWATRYGEVEKKKMALFERVRGWRNVVSNGIVPLIALIVFPHNPVPFIAAVAGAQADKFSSELGVLSTETPRNILTLRPSKKGRSGAITPMGLVMGLSGGLVIGLVSMILFKISATTMVVIGFCGLAGSIADSIAGVFEERGFGTKETSNIVAGLGAVTFYLAYLKLFPRLLSFYLHHKVL